MYILIGAVLLLMLVAIFASTTDSKGGKGDFGGDFGGDFAGKGDMMYMEEGPRGW